VTELPKKRSQESSKSEKSRKRGETGTCFDLKPGKAKPVLLDLESFKIYGYVLPYFFAHVATKYYLNKPLENLEPGDLQIILDTFCSHKKDAKDASKPPFVVPSNDREFADKCLAPKAVCTEIRKAIEEHKAEPVKVYGTILPETGEYVKLMFPKLQEFKRIDNLAIAPDLLALAVIGASISSLGTFGDERHYVFVDLIQEFRVDLKSLNDRSRLLVTKLINGNSSEIAIRVGIASLVADKAFRHLFELSELSRAVMYHVIIIGQRDIRGNIRKVMLKSFNQYDVTSLAMDIAELNIANPLVELIELYPSKGLQDEHSEARKLRRIIEATCKAIYTWHATRRLRDVREGNLEELYSALRALSVLASDHEELEKLDKFIEKHANELKTLNTLSGILAKLSERMRIPL
jgi:hypothetical protein